MYGGLEFNNATGDFEAPREAYFVGLDLAQRQDYTALAVLQRLQQEPPARPVFQVRTLHRFERETPYPTMADAVLKWMTTPPLQGAPLVVDATGVGAAVVDMLRQPGRPVRLVPVVITSGHAVSRDAAGLKIPKKELVSVLQVLLGSRRLAVAPSLPEARTLAKELQTFSVKITTAGNETFEAWREGDHDDLVLAVALAAWVGERMPAPFVEGEIVTSARRAPAADDPPRSWWEHVCEETGLGEWLRDDDDRSPSFGNGWGRG